MKLLSFLGYCDKDEIKVIWPLHGNPNVNFFSCANCPRL